MLYFLGNCQMDFLSRAMTDKGFDCSYRVLASPLTYTSSPGKIPVRLGEKVRDMGLGDFFHDRSLRNQFQMIGPEDEKPDLIIMNLFHENEPLFIHDKDKYVFFMDPAAWENHPEIERWMKDRCGMIQPNPATYLKRYGEMLATVRRLHPQVPIIVVSRLSHFPAFGPEPYSYLKGWAGLHQEAPAHFNLWTNQLDNLHMLDMDRVFSGIWAESDRRIETHCPFFKITLEEKDGNVTGLHASRDCHREVNDSILAKIEAFIRSGSVTYTGKETIPREWTRPWRPQRLDTDTMQKNLTSGGNYLCARAVGSFFIDLGTDYTDLLVAAGKTMPVCHNTLHMIKAYARILKNPALAGWCDAHRKTAEQFTANGPLYQKDYLKRIDEIRQIALSRDPDARP